MTTIVPPQNLEAEDSVLGAMLLSPRAIEVVAGIVSARDFYRESNGVIFKAALGLHEAGEPVDAITLCNALTQNGALAKVGGPGKISELVALVPAASNADHYAKIVADEAARRELIRAGQEIVRAVQAGGDINDLKAQAENYLAGVQHFGFIEQATSIIDGMDELLSEIREAYTTGSPIKGSLTGFRTIDDVMNGFYPGQFICIAARPGQGKSTLALNIAENFADRGDSALVVSLEMSKYELQIRSLARISEIDSRIISTGQMTEAQAGKLGAAIPIMQARRDHLFILDDGAVTMGTLRAEATRLLRLHNVSIIVVDYIQLMTGTGNNRTEEISEITRGLKMLARQLNVPVIGLSQMNRSIESRMSKRPILSDLRESGSLEQDADVVVFLHDDAAYDTDKVPDGTMEFIIAKNRKGPTDTLRLAFNRSWSRFLDMHKGPGE